MKRSTHAPPAGEADPDAEAIGAILAEVIQRRRDGEMPRVEEYVAKHPVLETVLREHFQMLELLEHDAPGAFAGGASGQIAPETAELAKRLGPAISALPDRMQRVIFLRNFENLRWAEIAERVGEDEEVLRRGYASVMRELLERCSASDEPS